MCEPTRDNCIDIDDRTLRLCVSSLPNRKTSLCKDWTPQGVKSIKTSDVKRTPYGVSSTSPVHSGSEAPQGACTEDSLSKKLTDKTSRELIDILPPLVLTTLQDGWYGNAQKNLHNNVDTIRELWSSLMLDDRNKFVINSRDPKQKK